MEWKGREQSSNIEDRGTSGMRGAGLNITALAPLVLKLIRTKGGRTILFIGVIACVVGPQFGFNPLSLLGLGGSTANAKVSEHEAEYREFAGVVLKETENVWGQIFKEQLGKRYPVTKMITFTGATNSSCGYATSATGPFYCPGDQQVYIDFAFYDQLEQELKAGGEFARAYVVAHEVGHHVQDVLGILDQVQAQKQKVSETEQNALQVRVELQADCLSGIWARHSQTALSLNEADLRSALNAAKQIGDDTLQKNAQGYAVPESFTHGTSEQRQNWFYRGYQSGKLSACDTFSVNYNQL